MTEIGIEERFKELEVKYGALKKRINTGILVVIVLFTGIMMVIGDMNSRSTMGTGKIIVPSDGLSFVTPDGKEIAGISAEEDGGALGIFNNQGKLVGTMGVSPNGGGFLDLLNNKEKLVGIISSSKYGGVLGIKNNQGKLVGTMGVSPNGDGFLDLLNNQGEHVEWMGATENGGTLGIYNNQENLIWKAR